MEGKEKKRDGGREKKRKNEGRKREYDEEKGNTKRKNRK